ncbi:T9SS type A sorting domain-containing protein [Winogradskyella sp. ECml5-4]|uniref:T9SS type A sorting domain-containing protein n=1 Tax=Winogradskyella sp. ECml5-4 TaxID=3110975 RepID=UPI002FF06999
MKKFYLAVILVFNLQFGFGQIGFEKRIIVDDSFNIGGYNSMSLSDINGDGISDLVVGSLYGNEISWLERIDEQGFVFGIPNIISTESSGESFVFVKDFDGDGDNDVVATSVGDDNVAWYENLDGLGNFGSQQLISNVGNPGSVVALDADGDGDNDIVYTSRVANNLVLHKNDGFGNFGPELVITSNFNNAIDVVALDVNNDGNVDLVASASNDISWFQYDPSIENFGMKTLIGYGAEDIDFADIDNDNDLDIVVTINDLFLWYENLDGLGDFSDSQLVTNNVNNAKAVKIIDADGDGNKDIITLSVFYGFDSYGQLTWFKNLDGFGNFGDEQLISNQVSIVNDLLGLDIDDDGDFDLIGATDNNIYSFYNLDGLGSFSSRSNITSRAALPEQIITGDIDNDGDLDVISANSANELAWYENIDGLGTFGPQKEITEVIENYNSVYAIDIDGDSDLDIIGAIRSEDEIAWYENLDGLGAFGEKQSITTDVDNGGDIFPVDIDNDGDIDILSASDNDNKIAWYENLDGTGSFGSQQIIENTFNGAVNSVYASDIDMDGDMDILASFSSDQIINWYENSDGQGTFGSAQMVATNVGAVSDLMASDLDLDGDMDIVAVSASYSNNVYWIENLNGLGSFGQVNVISSSSDGARGVYSSDLDGDGDKDIVVASSFDDEIEWYENIDGLGTFGTEQLLSINSDNAYSVYTSDINGDGRMDVISAARSGDELAWYKNIDAASNEIYGTVILDMDSDGCDAQDALLENILVSTTDGVEVFSVFTNANGIYQLFPDEGEFTTSVVSSFSEYYSISPNTAVSNFSGNGNTDMVDFCFMSIGEIDDLKISIYPSQNDPRPGFDTSYQLVFKNNGTTQISGSVSFEFNDSKLNFLNASETVASQTANTLSFDFTNLNPFETRIINLQFNVFPPPTTNINDILLSTATINPVTGDETEEDNTFSLEQTVIGSYDPNNITCLEGDEIFIEDVDKYLHYLIRFQNTGTASAINVRVEHVLDDKLDFTTMQLESLSHSGRVEIADQTYVRFVFDNINLPDSTNDEPNSHGYIAFKIKPKSDVVVGNIISGVADIYFDFNPAIITNTLNTEIVEPLSVDEFDLSDIKLFPNPTKDILRINSNKTIESIKLFNNLGQLLYLSTNTDSINLSSFKSGIYIIELKFSNQSFERKKIIKQ